MGFQKMSLGSYSKIHPRDVYIFVDPLCGILGDASRVKIMEMMRPRIDDNCIRFSRTKIRFSRNKTVTGTGRYCSGMRAWSSSLASTIYPEQPPELSSNPSFFLSLELNSTSSLTCPITRKKKQQQKTISIHLRYYR